MRFGEFWKCLEMSGMLWKGLERFGNFGHVLKELEMVGTVQ